MSTVLLKKERKIPKIERPNTMGKTRSVKTE